MYSAEIAYGVLLRNFTLECFESNTIHILFIATALSGVKDSN